MASIASTQIIFFQIFLIVLVTCLADKKNNVILILTDDQDNNSSVSCFSFSNCYDFCFIITIAMATVHYQSTWLTTQYIQMIAGMQTEHFFMLSPIAM